MMTNQASEGKQTKVIYEAMQIPYLSERHDAINAIIRTEKLKLLAEVRERIIGGNTPEGGYTTEPYLRMKQQEIRATNILRNVQRGELTKLEAEL